jgi:hypothetical protein
MQRPRAGGWVAAGTAVGGGSTRALITCNAALEIGSIVPPFRTQKNYIRVIVRPSTRSDLMMYPAELLHYRPPLLCSNFYLEKSTSQREQADD